MANSTLKSNKLVFGIIAILMLLVFLGSLTFLKNVYETEEYYVLNADVATRTQITAEMLQKVVTSKGTAPTTALAPKDVQSGAVYTRYPVRIGEIITLSNTGGLDDISIGIPDSWVVTSFQLPADNAVGGRISRGLYFDMMIVSDTGSFYPFINMLVLDTSVGLSGATSSNAVNTDEAKTGQTQFYYVGLTPEDAGYLQNIVSKFGGNMKLVLSPRENEYQKPNFAAYDGVFKYDPQTFEVKDSGEGTDNTFRDGERDKFGRLKNRDTDGNVKYPVKCGNAAGVSIASIEECETINNNTYSSTTTESVE